MTAAASHRRREGIGEPSRVTGKALVWRVVTKCPGSVAECYVLRTEGNLPAPSVSTLALWLECSIQIFALSVPRPINPGHRDALRRAVIARTFGARPRRTPAI